MKNNSDGIIIHQKKKKPNSPICLFLTKGVGIGKPFTIKFIIKDYWTIILQEQILRPHKNQILFMTSTCKVVFNIDCSTLHSTLAYMFNDHCRI